MTTSELKKVSLRSGFKLPRQVDFDAVANKSGTVAEVLTELCREHLGDENMAKLLQEYPPAVDVELVTGRRSDGQAKQERAVRLSENWDRIVPLLGAEEQSELGMAPHIDGGITAKAES